MINYGYFRHRFDAHQNTKLNHFVDDIGLVGYAYYYTLLELYGAKISKQDDKNKAEIHMRVIANTWRKRVDSCKKVLTKLQLSDLLVVTIIDSTCTIEIPNFSKYYGSYKKTKVDNAPNKKKVKENKEKESKIKESKPKNITSPLEFLTDEPDLKNWLRTGTAGIQNKILNEYTEKYLSSVIQDSYYWQLENKSRKAGTFLKSWIERDEKREYKIKMKSAFDGVDMEKIKGVI